MKEYPTQVARFLEFERLVNEYRNWPAEDKQGLADKFGEICDHVGELVKDQRERAIKVEKAQA